MASVRRAYPSTVASNSCVAAGSASNWATRLNFWSAMTLMLSLRIQASRGRRASGAYRLLPFREDGLAVLPAINASGSFPIREGRTAASRFHRRQAPSSAVQFRQYSWEQCEFRERRFAGQIFQPARRTQVRSASFDSWEQSLHQSGEIRGLLELFVAAIH